MAEKPATTRIEFTSVPRKNTRHDGWSAESQMIGSRRYPDGAGQCGALTTRSIFIDALAAGASVMRATRAAGRSLEGVVRFALPCIRVNVSQRKRRSPGALAHVNRVNLQVRYPASA